MTEIEKWIRDGADVREGLRLLSVYRPNPWLAALVERSPDRYGRLLRKALGVMSRTDAGEAAGRRRTMRDDWPFLGEPDCPAELKVLAADKITAMRGFAEQHEKLYACTTPEEAYETARKCILFYCQNRKIFSEFAYYKEHKSVLGKHEIFAETRRLRELRSAGILGLVRRQKNLLCAINKLKAKLRLGDRPDLELSRTELLMSKERELAEVDRLIAEYGKQYGEQH